MSSKIIISALFLLATSTAMAQTSGSQASSATRSDAGAVAQTGDIYFGASEQRRHTSVDTTPSVYVAPSTYGPSPFNCGASDSLAASITGIAFGISKAGEGKPCNTRADTSAMWQMGMKAEAKMRMMCFGEDVNRMVFEATGGACPAGATAKGLTSNNARVAQPVFIEH